MLFSCSRLVISNCMTPSKECHHEVIFQVLYHPIWAFYLLIVRLETAEWRLVPFQYLLAIVVLMVLNNGHYWPSPHFKVFPFQNYCVTLRVKCILQMSAHPWLNHRVKQMAIARGLLSPSEVYSDDDDEVAENSKNHTDVEADSNKGGMTRFHGPLRSRTRRRRCRIPCPAACYSKRGLTYTAFSVPLVGFLLIGALLQLDFSGLLLPLLPFLPLWMVYLVKALAFLFVSWQIRTNILKLSTNEYTVSLLSYALNILIEVNLKSDV